MMQVPIQSSPSRNPPHGLTEGIITTKRGMDADFYDAAVKGLVEVMQRYRDSLSSQVTATGNTVLHLHVGIPGCKGRIPKTQFIQTVLGYDRSLLLQKNENEEIPLHQAARLGHTGAVEVFISQAAEMGVECLREMLMTTDRKKDTALHHAARWNNVQTVEFLVRADRDCPYARNVDGQTPLYIAAERKYLYVVVGILEACESPAYGGSFGRTALHAAVLHEDEGHNSAVYIQDKDGRTALHLAFLYGDVQRIKALIEHRPDCSEISDKKGRNLFHFAAESKCRPTIEYLFRNDIFNKLLNEQDQEGNTPLHLLVTYATFSGLFYTQYLRPFRKNRYIDSKAFNNQNQTAGDIVHSQYPFRPTQIPRSIYRLTPRYIENLENNNTSMSRQKKSSEVHLVVATLIATVSFAAGIAVPGGFNQDPGADRGSALLTRQTAFRAFMVSDAMSLALSAVAILLQFRIVEAETLRIVRIYYTVSVAATSLSIGTMMVSFMTGAYGTVYHSLSLAVIILIFPTLFMFFYVTYLLYKVRHFYRSLTSAFNEKP